MNLIAASAGCVESGNDLAERDSLAWRASAADARRCYDAMLAKCRAYVATQAKIVTDRANIYTFSSPFFYRVIWICIDDPLLNQSRRPFPALRSLMRCDPSLGDRLREFVIEVHSGGHDARGPFEATREAAMETALEDICSYFES